MPGDYDTDDDENCCYLINNNNKSKGKVIKVELVT